MLPGSFQPCLAFLVILLGARQRINCEVWPIDTCALLDERRDADASGDISRVDIPERAGKEGIDLRKGIVGMYTNPAEEDFGNTTWSLKYHARIGPPKTENYRIFGFSVRRVQLLHLTNGSLFFHSNSMPDSPPINIVIDNAKGGTESTASVAPSVDDSDNSKDSGESAWVDLVGMKLKISHDEQKPSDEPYWIMIGVEYSKYPNREGYLRVYINGKLSVDLILKNDKAKNILETMTVANGEFSCIQYRIGKMDEDYFKDFKLNECKQYYKGKPQEKFAKCQENLGY